MHCTFKHYTLRDWEPRDRHPAATVIATALEEYGLGWDPEGADRDVLAVEACYLEAGGEFWVIEQSGHIVGTGAYYPIRRGSSAVFIADSQRARLRAFFTTAARGGDRRPSLPRNLD
jgi:putative acetyltransferase